MSKIRVWTSDGEWSKEVEGLDKIHFMKKAVCLYAPSDEDPDSLEGFELDGDAIDGECSMLVKKAKTFKLPLPALMSVKKYDPLCAALYDELLNAAKVPAKATKDYCLLFKFEDE